MYLRLFQPAGLECRWHLLLCRETAGKHFPIFSRCAAVYYFKHTYEGRQACISGAERGIRDGYVRVCKKPSRMLDSFLVQILIKSCSSKLLEKPGEVIFAEPGLFCNIIKIQRFAAVFVNIIADKQELFRIFPVCMAAAAEMFEMICYVVPDQDENLQ